MSTIQRFARHISFLLIIAIAMLLLPHRPALAAMAGTESVIASAPTTPWAKAGNATVQRQQIKAFLQRKEVRANLLSHGISAEEARARIDSLTDNEISAIAGRLNELRAGGASGAFAGFGPGAEAVLVLGAVAVVAVVALVVWLISKGDTPDASASGKLGRYAKSGSAEAQHQLGSAYLTQGKISDGWRWVCAAANQGHADAQHAVGYFYEGRSAIRWRSLEPAPVKPNLVRAHMWYSLAASQGIHEAAFLRDGLEARMGPSQKLAAKKAEMTWRPNPASCEAQTAPPSLSAGR